MSLQMESALEVLTHTNQLRVEARTAMQLPVAVHQKDQPPQQQRQRQQQQPILTLYILHRLQKIIISIFLLLFVFEGFHHCKWLISTLKQFGCNTSKSM